MLPLLLMVLLSAGVLSQPLQQNCKASERQFRDCLRTTYLKLSVLEYEKLSPLATTSAVLLCEAQKSDCPLQKRLTTIVDELTDWHKIMKNGSFPLHDDQYKKCVDHVSASHSTECRKVSTYDKHGFKLEVSHDQEQSEKYYSCLLDYTKTSEVCHEEDVKKYQFAVRQHLVTRYTQELRDFFLFLNGLDISFLG